jgi:hypothetical protein
VLAGPWRGCASGWHICEAGVSSNRSFADYSVVRLKVKGGSGVEEKRTPARYVFRSHVPSSKQDQSNHFRMAYL